MIIFCLVIMLLINLMAVMLYKKLSLLHSVSQIQAELEMEMHTQAHNLLVRRDQIELGLIEGPKESAYEQWKGDLAEYMEEFEQEALLRSKRRLNRV